MKIIQVTSQFPPYVGGMGIVVKEISERLITMGHNVDIYTPDNGIKKNKIKSNSKLKINYIKSYLIAHTPFAPLFFFKLLKLPKESKIVHLHIGQAFIPEITCLACKIRGIPYVAQLHLEMAPSGKVGLLLPLYKKIILRRVFKNAKKVICLSQSHKSYVSKYYGIDINHIEVVPNGINECYFVKSVKKKNKNLLLLFVGRLVKQKNPVRLIEAFRLIDNRNILLNVVGNGEDKLIIKNLISKYKLNNVKILGKKTGKELLNYYKKSDIFILTSDYEGLPLVLLEAMASGCAIVASKIRGVEELVGNFSLLTSPLTAIEFSKNIKKLIENEKLRIHFANKGLKEARKYDWIEIVKKFEKIYTENW